MMTFLLPFSFDFRKSDLSIDTFHPRIFFSVGTSFNVLILSKSLLQS